MWFVAAVGTVTVGAIVFAVAFSQASGVVNHFGKYRGKVENNVDPSMRGRVQVSCPAVLGEGTLSWAMPCAPYAGSGVGFFTIPPVGASVWVEFEAGDTDYPIWSGCFWEPGEAPARPAVPQTKVIKTEMATVTLSDVPGSSGITLETATGQRIVMSESGIEIDNGMGDVIRLTGS
jgi:uncharacterized protein involved in type VI secretion and phage assembly